jgi:polar amino acid transport system substrate-binding protein
MALLAGCAPPARSGTVRLGIDPSWYPLNFRQQNNYVNGFVDDLLQEIARETGISFERQAANWDTIYSGLKEGQFDAVLAALPPYSYNAAKYDFSQMFLATGPVLITRQHDAYRSLADLKNEVVGYEQGTLSVELLAQEPSLIPRSYPLIPDVLRALADEQIAAAVVDRLPAISYVSDLFSGSLKIASSPLNATGLRLVALKGKEEKLIAAFDKALKKLDKKKKLEKLRAKWSL